MGDFPVWWLENIGGLARLTSGSLLTLWQLKTPACWTGIHAHVTSVRRKPSHSILTLHISAAPFRAYLFCSSTWVPEPLPGGVQDLLFGLSFPFGLVCAPLASPASA